jgi:hypothetical protein
MLRSIVLVLAFFTATGADSRTAASDPIASTHSNWRTAINDNGLPGHALRFAIGDDQLRNIIRASGSS